MRDAPAWIAAVAFGVLHVTIAHARSAMIDNTAMIVMIWAMSLSRITHPRCGRACASGLDGFDDTEPLAARKEISSLCFCAVAGVGFGAGAIIGFGGFGGSCPIQASLPSFFPSLAPCRPRKRETVTLVAFGPTLPRRCPL